MIDHYGVHESLEFISPKFAPKYSGAMERPVELGGTKERLVQLNCDSPARVKD